MPLSLVHAMLLQGYSSDIEIKNSFLTCVIAYDTRSNWFEGNI